MPSFSENVWWDGEGVMQVSSDEEGPEYGYMKYHVRKPCKVFYVVGDMGEIELDGVSYEVETSRFGKETWYEIMDDDGAAIGHYVPEDNSVQWTTTEEMMKHEERICVMNTKEQEDYQRSCENNYKCCGKSSCPECRREGPVH
jgi:hypothetical protein